MAIGKKLHSPCPFCGGSLQASLHLYKAKKFLPHLEAECTVCRVRIAWPGRRGSTPSDLIALADQRVPCMSACGNDAMSTVRRWRGQPQHVGGQA